MYLGMRDVIASKTIPDWRVFLDLGVTAMEIRVEPDLTVTWVGGEGHHVRDREGKDRLLDHLGTMGICVKGFVLNTQFDGSPEEVEWVRASAAFAGELGIPVMRVDCRRSDPGDAHAREALLRGLGPTFEALLDVASESGVGLALENHGPFTNRSEVVDALLDRFAPRGLSLCLDTGNFYVTGGLPLSAVYDAIERFAPHVTTTHLKNATYPPELRETQRDTEKVRYRDHSVPIEAGDVDHVRVCEILERAGYDGPLFYEDEYLYYMPEDLVASEVMRTTILALKERLAPFLSCR